MLAVEALQEKVANSELGQEWINEMIPCLIEMYGN